MRDCKQDKRPIVMIAVKMDFTNRPCSTELKWSDYSGPTRFFARAIQLCCGEQPKKAWMFCHGLA